MTTTTEDSMKRIAEAYAGRRAALEQLGQHVLERTAAARDGIGDSDLADEQPVSVTISTTLGELRKAGLGSIDGYCDHASFCRRERLPKGTWVRSMRSMGLILGTCIGYDEDLDLPVIAWEGDWAHIGPETCKPSEYQVLDDASETAESRQDRHDDMRRDAEHDAAHDYQEAENE